MPTFSDDDFLQFCVVEALFARHAKNAEEQQKAAEREEWKKGKPGAER